MNLFQVPQDETRSPAELNEHYEIEKELASRLRNSDKRQRREQHLYMQVYDELFKRVRNHPQLTKKINPALKEREIAHQKRLITPFLNPQSVFLELGPGDCQLSFAICRDAKKVYAVDVSLEITKDLAQPKNFELLFSDGASIPLPPGSVDFAYSNQLMEHCHPDDAVEQLENLFHCLAPGGRYLCVTPHRFSGPHDISCFFSEVATGFHLKEYTNRELYSLFTKIGFKRVVVFWGARNIFLRLPIQAILCIEDILGILPFRLRRFLSGAFPFKQCLGIRLLAMKPPHPPA